MSKKHINKKLKIDKLDSTSIPVDNSKSLFQQSLLTTLAELNTQRLITVTSLELIWYYDDSISGLSSTREWKRMNLDTCKQINQFLSSPAVPINSTNNIEHLKFKYGSWNFDFDKKIQINCITDKQRAIKSELRGMITKPNANHWDTLPLLFQSLTSNITNQCYEIQREVNKDSQEWQLVVQYFNRGAWLRKPKIRRLVAHINPFKAKLYELTKEQLKHNGQVNEIIAWHGTKNNDPAVVVQRGGVDMRYGIKGMFGQAAYITEDASFVHANEYRFTKEIIHERVLKNGQKRKQRERYFIQLMVKAIVGNYKYVPAGEHTNKSMLLAPEVFDSIYSFTSDEKTNMFVIYDNNQLYTSYSIEYKR
jgi:hypothetical protein